MADLGSDVSTYIENDEGELDLDPFFGVISGPPALAECQTRRLETPSGSLPWDLDAGYDLLALVNKSGVAAIAVQAAVDAEMRKDERVDDVDVTCVVDASGDPTISVAGLSGQGPFSLVVQPPDLSGAIQIITNEST